MKFHILLPVRDEADVIEESLEHALTWADAIYVFDTGSADETWEIVQACAARDARVIPLRKEPVYFSETRLRSWIFDKARQHMREGDWFLRMDADEFHHVPPPEFVRTQLRPHETIVYHQYYDFRLTTSEVEAWERGEESWQDRARPIEERRRHYTMSAYSEPRLCRYRESMKWPATVSFPYNAGYVARKRLPIRHYPHRDPVQLQRRCRLRAIMMADAENRSNWSQPELHHWAEKEWRRFIAKDDLPGLRYWAPGTELPVPAEKSHLRTMPVRMLQRFIHACCLPLLDRLRPARDPNAVPQPIPVKVLRLLEKEMGE